MHLLMAVPTLFLVLSAASAQAQPKPAADSLDRTVLPIPEPKTPHSTVLDARNAQPRRGSR